jgi:hypothetical protein
MVGRDGEHGMPSHTYAPVYGTYESGDEAGLSGYDRSVSGSAYDVGSQEVVYGSQWAIGWLHHVERAR